MKNALILSALIGLSSISNAEVIARVGEVTITDTEFKKSYAEALRYAPFAARPPSKREHLEDMIKYRVGLQEAKRRKLASHPTVKKAMDMEMYKGLLELSLGNQVGKIKVSDSEMKSYYRANPFIRSSQIFVSFPLGANASQIKEAKVRALKIYSALRKSKRKWEDNVRIFSDDIATKNIGGEMGVHTAQTVLPVYYAALKKLKLGEISAPVQGVYGFHIIKKTGVLAYKDADKNSLQMAVFDVKRRKLMDRYFNQLKTKYKISVAKIP